MISNKGIVLVVALLLSLSLATGPAVAKQSCKKVNANIKAFSEFWTNPDLCNGYEFCQYAEVRGTLNGLWWIYGNFDDFEMVAGGDGNFVRPTISVFETNQGDLYTDDMEMANLEALNGAVFHDAVTGGTGRYEGASSGWLAGWFSFGPVRGKIAGQICWNGD